MGTTLHTTSSIITIAKTLCYRVHVKLKRSKKQQQKTFASLHMHCTAESKKNTEKSYNA